MKSAKHQFNTVHGLIEVQVYIFDMDKVEAIDIYDQDAKRFSSGGWRIEGFVNGTPRGTHFYPKGMLGTSYFGEGTEDAVRSFLAEAHQDLPYYNVTSVK